MIKDLINKLLIDRNIKLNKLTQDEYGQYLEHDIRKLFKLIEKDSPKPVVFDVGANIGQSVSKFKKYSHGAQIHTFEPSSETFKMLLSNTKQYLDIIHNNIGLGAEVKTMDFYNNEKNDVSSFLTPTDLLWGEVQSVETLSINTLSKYCQEKMIKKVNYLKIDTQGFELEVFKGGDDLLESKRIDVIQFEITLEHLYNGLPRMDEILKYLFDFNYHLVAFYGYHNQHIRARWTDAIFISPGFKG